MKTAILLSLLTLAAAPAVSSADTDWHIGIGVGSRYYYPETRYYSPPSYYYDHSRYDDYCAPRYYTPRYYVEPRYYYPAPRYYYDRAPSYRFDFRYDRYDNDRFDRRHRFDNTRRYR
jgi:hypothetical protein